MLRHGPRAGQRVLDVGCGFGDTSVALAGLVQSMGSVLAVDGAPRFIAQAKQEAQRAGLLNLEYKVADVQTAKIPGAFDLVFSRFGVMFFSNPVVAMRNLRATLEPDGRLCVVVWCAKTENAWAAVPEAIVRSLLPPPDEKAAPTCGPGPFSMADTSVVSQILTNAGYSNIAFERNDSLVRVGHHVNDAIEFALSLGPAGEVMRLAGEAAEKHRPQVETALREALKPFVTANGIEMPSSTWIVTAHA